jgi:benzoyl-CoA reductase/2-hydroxyglutaryl-CoA dehydratase subunit BcrC/BadD/HgdB
MVITLRIRHDEQRSQTKFINGLVLGRWRMGRIGLTTTVPVEIIFAAGHTPVDLNNAFVTRSDSMRMVEEAEAAGYPRNVCGWIKGLYTTVIEDRNIDEVIAVTQGDCSSTHALMETYELAGIHTVSFAYPCEREYDLLLGQMGKLISHYGTDWDTVQQTKTRLDAIRKKVWEIDRLTWQENRVGGWDNHLWQVSCSDFNGHPDSFAEQVDIALQRFQAAPVLPQSLRLGFIGVPPIWSDLYAYLESMGARVVFNEVQRQFSMPFVTTDIVEQYRLYTYPYGVFGRIADIEREIECRNLDGIIHYVQSFCFRQIEDMVIRAKLDIPMITIEGDKPGELDARTKLRLDSFVEMLR